MYNIMNENHCCFFTNFNIIKLSFLLKESKVIKLKNVRLWNSGISLKSIFNSTYLKGHQFILYLRVKGIDSLDQ